LLPRSILIEKSYLRWKYPHEPGKDDKKAPPYSSQESVMARLSGSGSSIKVWLEKWVLDQLLINVVHGGRSMGIDLQERVDKTLQLNWSQKERELFSEDIARKIQATPFPYLTGGIALGGDRQPMENFHSKQLQG
jgi:hypothetical protein